MQTAYLAEALGSGAAFLSHAQLLPRAASGPPLPYIYHNGGSGEPAVMPPHFLSSGYNSITPALYPSMGIDMAAAVASQQQAYSLPAYNYSSPFTAALAGPLLNAVQSSLATATNNSGELPQVLPSPAQPSATWGQDFPSSGSGTGQNGLPAAPQNIQQSYAGVANSLAPEQDNGAAVLDNTAGALSGNSASRDAAISGYSPIVSPGYGSTSYLGSTADYWRQLAAATAGGMGAQSSTLMQAQPTFGSEYQNSYAQQQHGYAGVAPPLQAPAAALPMNPLSLGYPPGALGLHRGPVNTSSLLQQLLQQQQQQANQVATVTPASLSDPALAAAAATALHLLQLPAGLRALAACSIMPNLIQPQQLQQPQPQQLQLPGYPGAAAAGYPPGLLSTLFPQPAAANGGAGNGGSYNAAAQPAGAGAGAGGASGSGQSQLPTLSPPLQVTRSPFPPPQQMQSDILQEPMTGGEKSDPRQRGQQQHPLRQHQQLPTLGNEASRPGAGTGQNAGREQQSMAASQQHPSQQHTQPRMPERAQSGMPQQTLEAQPLGGSSSAEAGLGAAGAVGPQPARPPLGVARPISPVVAAGSAPVPPNQRPPSRNEAHAKTPATDFPAVTPPASSPQHQQKHPYDHGFFHDLLASASNQSMAIAAAGSTPPSRPRLSTGTPRTDDTANDEVPDSPSQDGHTYDDETSSRSPSPAPSGPPHTAASAGPSTTAPGPALTPGAALLFLGLQQQQQHQHDFLALAGKPVPSAQSPAVVQLRPPALKHPPQPASSLTLALPQLPHQPQAPAPQPLLHLSGLPLQVPLPHPAVVAYQQSAAACPQTAAATKSLLAAVATATATATACTSTSGAPNAAPDPRRRMLADRRERRKESNRESARRCRLRREKDSCDLSRRMTVQETANGCLVGQIQRLEKATSMLLEQNTILGAWLEHIQSAGDGAPSAAATILGYLRTLDEQMAAAAAAADSAQLHAQGAGTAPPQGLYASSTLPVAMSLQHGALLATGHLPSGMQGPASMDVDYGQFAMPSAAGHAAMGYNNNLRNGAGSGATGSGGMAAFVSGLAEPSLELTSMDLGEPEGGDADEAGAENRAR